MNELRLVVLLAIGCAACGSGSGGDADADTDTDSDSDSDSDTDTDGDSGCTIGPVEDLGAAARQTLTHVDGNFVAAFLDSNLAVDVWWTADAGGVGPGITPFPTGAIVYPQVAGGASRFMTAWGDGGLRLYAFDLETEETADVTLPSENVQVAYPVIAAAVGEDRFLVAWIDDTSGALEFPQGPTKAAIVDGYGAVSTGPVDLLAAGEFALAVAPRAAGWSVCVSHGTGSEAPLEVRALDEALSVTANVEVSHAGARYAFGEIAWNGEETGVLWTEDADAREVWFGRLDADGAPAGDAVRLATDPDSRTGRSLAWDGVGWLAATLGSRNVRVARIRADGVIEHDSVIADAGEPMADFGVPRVAASPEGASGVAWVEVRGADPTLHFARLSCP